MQPIDPAIRSYYDRAPEESRLELGASQRSGGVLIAAGISRWASTLDGLARELLRDPEFVRIVERDLRDGHHQNTTGRADYFTTAYFHRPDDLRREIVDAGFEAEGLYGVEGPVGFFRILTSAGMIRNDANFSFRQRARSSQSRRSLDAARI